MTIHHQCGELVCGKIKGVIIIRAIFRLSKNRQPITGNGNRRANDIFSRSQGVVACTRKEFIFNGRIQDQVDLVRSCPLNPRDLN